MPLPRVLMRRCIARRCWLRGTLTGCRRFSGAWSASLLLRRRSVLLRPQSAADPLRAQVRLPLLTLSPARVPPPPLSALPAAPATARRAPLQRSRRRSHGRARVRHAGRGPQLPSSLHGAGMLRAPSSTRCWKPLPQRACRRPSRGSASGCMPATAACSLTWLPRVRVPQAQQAARGLLPPPLRQVPAALAALQKLAQAPWQAHSPLRVRRARPLRRSRLVTTRWVRLANPPPLPAAGRLLQPPPPLRSGCGKPWASARGAERRRPTDH